MARELRRLLIAAERLAAGGCPLPLETAERHYLGRVLRLRDGDRFAIGDGAGRLWTARLRQGTAELEQPLATPLQCEPPPHPRLTLAVALPRRDAEVLMRMACEIGIDALLPVLAERSSPAERFRPDRFEAVLREAAEQAERLWLPRLLPPVRAQALLETPWPGTALLATTRSQDLPLLDQRLDVVSATDAPGGVVLAIGPEGGWSPGEEAAGFGAGWLPVSLGPTILRVSTAAVVGAAALLRWRRELTCRSCSAPSP